jgi:hypothetical protein
MDVADICAQLQGIRNAAATGDTERAHGLEDELWGDVLQAIADGKCRDPRACAQLALTTTRINFHRWCA